MSSYTCNKNYLNGGVRSFQKEIMLCAGTYMGGKDSYLGDSGGPLIDMRKRVVGITSWGAGCGQAKYPGVYTRISGVKDW